MLFETVEGLSGMVLVSFTLFLLSLNIGNSANSPLEHIAQLPEFIADCWLKNINILPNPGGSWALGPMGHFSNCWGFGIMDTDIEAFHYSMSKMINSGVRVELVC